MISKHNLEFTIDYLLNLKGKQIDKRTCIQIENQCHLADKMWTSKLDETNSFSDSFQCFCYGSFKINNKENLLKLFVI